jgi:hypothetical protein
MAGRNGSKATENTPTQFAVALAAWPPEVRVGLAEVALPQVGEAALDLGQGKAVEVTTRDLAQIWLVGRLQTQASRERRRRLSCPRERTGVHGNNALGTQAGR